MIATRVFGYKDYIDGWRFSNQFQLYNPKSNDRKPDDHNWKTMEAYAGHYNQYGHLLALPGQKVYVIQRHKRLNKWRILKCKVTNVMCYGSLASKSLRDYWLDRAGVGHGMEFGINVYLNLNQAKIALASAIRYKNKITQ